jgi:LysM repeat protein
VSGAGFDSISRLRRKIAARGLRLLAVALLVFTGCATRTSHVVRPNETLAGLAEAYGIDPDQFARINEFRNADRIEVGQRLVLPPGAQIVHLVRAGETLREIADRYRVRVSTIRQLNRIGDPDRIVVGQRLRLPQEANPSSRPTPASTRPPAPTRAQALLVEAEEHYLAARFEPALERSREADVLLKRESDRSKLRARAAFVAGSALAGLGEEQRASEQFARVHALDSRFEPPAGWLSPRLGALYGSASAK